MVDAYKCQNCGEVVGRPQSCPSCGETAMRPTRVPESTLEGTDEPADGEPTGDGAAPSSPTTADGRPGDRSETSGQRADDDGSGHRRERTKSSDSGGLLAWLKSLF